jgi:hypothetical protein
MKFVDFPLPATMDVFKDKLLIISWENVTGILISSKEIAEHFRNYLIVCGNWQLGNKYQIFNALSDKI